MKDTQKAFNWIIDLLEEKKIKYQITGGMAAQVYGSKRELADIDIDISEKDLYTLSEEVTEYCIFGPKRYKDEQFDIDLMTLKYADQEIDLAGFGTGKLFDAEKQEWIDDEINPDSSEVHAIYSREVPVISRESFIAYKSVIARDVDLEDLRWIRS